MRYVQIPETIAYKNTITDEPIVRRLQSGEERPETCTFAQSVRMALTVLAATKAEDILKLLDIRMKFDRAMAGEIVELDEDNWKLIETQFKRPDPNFFPVQWAFSAQSHQKAILSAPDKKPAVLVPVPEPAAEQAA